MLKLDEMKILNEPDRLYIRHPGDWAIAISGSSPQGTMVGGPAPKIQESFNLSTPKCCEMSNPRDRIDGGWLPDLGELVDRG